jgi:hypothetical protein
MPQKINGNDVYTVTVSIQDIAGRFTPITRTFTLTVYPCSQITTTSTTTTILSTPSAPLNLTASAYPSYYRLDWDAPSFNGGSPVTEYITEYSLDGGITWNIYESDNFGNINTELSTEQIVTFEYTYVCFRVKAKNAIGTSIYSNMVCIEEYMS